MLTRLNLVVALATLAAWTYAETLPARAQAVISTGQSFVTARLLPGVGQEDGSRIIALRLALADGWKTYWRSPGEAGIPPHFDWAGSSNIAEAEILWPRPELFESFGYRTVGYSHQIVLPIHIVPADPSRPLGISLMADIGVCRELCVIERVELGELIAPDAPDIGAGQVHRALAEVPRPASEVGVRLMACRISGAGPVRHLDALLTADTPLSGAEAVVEGSKRLWVTETASHVQDDGLHISAEIELADGGTWVPRSDLRITVLAEGFAADLHGCTPS